MIHALSLFLAAHGSIKEHSDDDTNSDFFFSETVSVFPSLLWRASGNFCWVPSTPILVGWRRPKEPTGQFIKKWSKKFPVPNDILIAALFKQS